MKILYPKDPDSAMQKTFSEEGDIVKRVKSPAVYSNVGALTLQRLRKRGMIIANLTRQRHFTHKTLKNINCVL